MSKLTTPLTEMQVRNAKPKEKPYKLFDGGGLYLDVAPSGSRIWRLKFRQPNGKENRLTFGPYPEITLQEARQKRLETRRLMLAGTDPAKHRDDAKRLAAQRAANTFEKSMPSPEARSTCFRTSGTPRSRSATTPFWSCSNGWDIKGA